MKTYCCTEKRRNLIRNQTELNGIDYLEVVSTDVDADVQRFIRIQFLKELVNPIVPENIFLSKNDALVQFDILSVNQTDTDSITIELSEYGDFSTYTLHFLSSWEEKEFLDGFDKLLSSIEFSFKVECPTDFDCKAETEDCSAEELAEALGINYLTKDYASFRQLILDRMAVLAPKWTERNPADIGITLVELIAYVGDYLSYRQDAITSEAYLGTARKRISVKRHARLVDYYMHEGVNARTWVHFDVAEDSNGQTIHKVDANDFRTKIITSGRLKDKEQFVVNPELFYKNLTNGQIVFEPMHDLQLFFEHNSISFHNYGNEDCCLPKGATEATLIGRLENLRVNDVLILKEIRGPKTGSPTDANPKNRHAVKLNSIDFDTDFDFSVSPAQEIDITIVRWSEEDALPFPLCVSASVDISEREEVIEVSIAQGNNLLADHGMSFSDLESVNPSFPFEEISGALIPLQVPESKYQYASSQSQHCGEESTRHIPPRYRPMVKAFPITHAEKLTFVENDASDLAIPASKLLKQQASKALACIELTEVVDSGAGFELLADKWLAVKDLLIDSSNQDQHFVVENDSNSRSFLRFGNQINGKFPTSNSKLLAEYRVGNGSVGNVGRDSLSHIVTTDVSLNLLKITNPFAATSGRDAESMEEVKQYAPQAFRTQERAVTIEDYENVAKRCKEDIQSVSASMRWTGSWHTAFITADRQGAKAVTADWENELKDCLQTYRLTGIDLEVDEPKYVGLELAMTVCIVPQSFRIDVLRNIRNSLSNTIKNGKRGFFHPDNLVFGQSLYLSELYSILQNIPSVESVKISKFQRYGLPNTSGILTGKLDFGKKEIPRLDNDPNKKDMGILSIEIKGGR